MKYVRYDLKKKRDNSIVFVLLIITILLFAFVIGTVISNVLIKNSKPTGTSNSQTSNTSTDAYKLVKFIAVQGGIYKNKTYAETCKDKLKEFGIPFTIEDEKGNRIFLGIYAEKASDSITKTLTDKGVDNSKMTFELHGNDLTSVEVIEAIDANLQILNKLSEKGVKSYTTDTLKKWADENLKVEDEKSKDYGTLKNLKTHISSMPKEISRDQVEKDYAYLYNILKKISTE